MTADVYVTGSFDDLRSRHVRFLEGAARLGRVHVLLWSDALAAALCGKGPKFPQAERRYFLESIRYVDRLTLIEGLDSADELPAPAAQPSAIWAVDAETDHPAKRSFCQARSIDYRVIAGEGACASEQACFTSPPRSAVVTTSGRKKVVVTGCYDWLHTGHVRFFEEAAQLGDLHVVIGSDQNVRLLKGAGHPLFPQDERRYMVQAIRYVTQTFVSSGSGWMDAEPEIEQIRPDLYVVNEDGDKPEKRAFCQAHGLEYVILKRLPKEGLPRRESTQLRGF